MRFFASLMMFMAVLASPLFAQEDDKGFIAGLLESSLAGDGRTVQINGFRGALSQEATVSSIVILDDEGEWLRLENLALQLNRRALLGGRVEVKELSAKVITLSRLPVPPETDLPPAEAQGFSLPELPVSIDIKRLIAEQIILGESVLGEPAELSLTAALSLIDGEAIAKLSAQRTDAKRGSFEIDAGFQGDEQIVDLNIRLDEGENGIAARLLGLPGNPSTKLDVVGSGPLNDLKTDIKIATDGQERLTGTVTLKANAPAAEGATVSRSFNANVSGDVTALFAPQYRPFFGDKVSLVIDGQRGADGALDISSLDLTTKTLELNGAVTLNRDYWPTNLTLKGRIENEEDTLITLPISGAETKLRKAILDVQFDQAQSDAWTGAIQIEDLVRDDVTIAKAELRANGTLNGKVNAIGAVSADINIDISGINLTDPALNRAIGDAISGRLNVGFVEGQPLKLSNMAISGTDFTLTGNAEISDLATGLDTSFRTSLVASDIARFSDLAGSQMGGAVEVDMDGSADLGGAFNIALAGKAENLEIGQELPDKLLRGQTNLTLSANRNSVGTQIKTLTIRNPQLTLSGNGLLTSDGSDVAFQTTLNDTSQLSEILEGPATVEGTATQRNGEWSVDVEAVGPFSAKAQIVGLVTGPDANVNFNASLPDINPLAPPYRGAVSVSGAAQNSTDGWRVDTSLNGPYGLTAKVDGRVTGNAAPDITFTANLPNVAPFVPKMNGPLSLTGDLQQISASRWNVGADLIGPAGTTATLNGSVSPNGRMDISINGDAQLALANPFLTPRSISGDATFNLRVNGPPDISSISGTIRASNARAVAPNLQLALQNIAAEVSLSSGRANIDLNGQVSNGGRLRLTGPLGLTGSMPANLRMALDGVVIEDPSLYKTTLDGELGVDGPLLSNARISGRIDVGETQISIPSSGISSFGTIPNITHVNVPTKVQRTRVKAGLVQTEDQSSSASGPRYPLDITISAPRQIFVRGRGLDAELGGQLRLTGTTANIISAGRFELQRGRLDILSKRFNLDEGIIQLQGDFDPFIRFVAITNTDVGTASVVVEGLATDPEVRFESSPDAPQDEVLAQIFFGRDVSQISALQALQLASAVATLAGRGGEGVVSKLRRSFDLDDLDITTDEQGNAGLRAGKYISDNIYTDVTVGTNNNAEVSLNIDITPTITATGKLGSDGDTSLGIYFQKDY